MCRKSPAVKHFYKKIISTKKSDLYAELEDSPLNVHEYAFACDIIAGLNLVELAEKYHLSYSRTSQWKREVCEKVLAFDVANMR